MSAPPIRKGELVMDRESGRVGVLMAFEAGIAWLRPQAGGREWTTQAGAIRPATPSEQLRAQVAAANARSRGRL